MRCLQPPAVRAPVLRRTRVSPSAASPDAASAVRPLADDVTPAELARFSRFASAMERAGERVVASVSSTPPNDRLLDPSRAELYALAVELRVSGDATGAAFAEHLLALLRHAFLPTTSQLPPDLRAGVLQYTGLLLQLGWEVGGLTPAMEARLKGEAGQGLEADAAAEAKERELAARAERAERLAEEKALLDAVRREEEAEAWARAAAQRPTPPPRPASPAVAADWVPPQVPHAGATQQELLSLARRFDADPSSVASRLLPPSSDAADAASRDCNDDDLDAKTEFLRLVGSAVRGVASLRRGDPQASAAASFATGCCSRLLSASGDEAGAALVAGLQALVGPSALGSSLGSASGSSSSSPKPELGGREQGVAGCDSGAMGAAERACLRAVAAAASARRAAGGVGWERDALAHALAVFWSRVDAAGRG